MRKKRTRRNNTEEWNFENWGVKYWSQTPEFLQHLDFLKQRAVRPMKEPT